MIITYSGEQFFKITQGDLVLAFNPVAKDAKSKISTYFGADVGLITTNYSLFNGVSQISHGDRVPFIIRGPGDYEVKDIFFKGIISSASVNGENYINTVYSFMLDGMRIAFLGAIANGELSKEIREYTDSADILFIPIGGTSVSKEVTYLDPKKAASLASAIEPKLIIPMSYDDASLKIFLKEMGEEDAEIVDKLTLKSKDLDDKEANVIVIKYS